MKKIKILRGSLIWKLTLAFLLVAVTAAALLAISIRLTSSERLSTLVLEQQRSALQTVLVDYYAERGSWAGVVDAWDELQPRNPRPTEAPVFPSITEQPPREERNRLFGLADEQGVVLVPVDPRTPAGTVVPAEVLDNSTPIEVNGEGVGWILTASLRPSFSPEEDLYLQRTNQALLVAALGAVLLALVVGALLAFTLIRPLHALMQAAQKIARGDLEQRVEVRSRDEIGQLGEAFNRMSAEVARANQLRRQMTADIAHDLRTPLTVIAGYIEAMRDEILPPTTERLTLIYEEIERLQSLVDDLRMLTQAESGELSLIPEKVTPQWLLERAAAPYQDKAAQQGISLQVQAQEALPDVRVDEARMMQVFGNLLSNALRYTPSGGEIVLTARRDGGGGVCLSVRDTGTGIAEEDLPHIFERFYRADRARSDSDGESGLGLAIARALVEAHSGTIDAESTPGQETVFSIHLPAG